MQAKIVLALLANLLFAGIIYSQDYKFELECSELKYKKNAHSVWVVIKKNKDEEVKLLLIGKSISGKILWQQSFPKTGDWINPPKTFIECSEQEIKVISQKPFSAHEVVQTYRWKDEKLTIMDSLDNDPSMATIEAAISQALAGKTASGIDAIMYPSRYVHADLLRETIEKGHHKALKAYRAKNVDQAVKILDSVLELTANLAMTVVYLETADDDNRFNNWVNAWKQVGLNEEDFIAALNDFGFFLQENRQIILSVSVLEAVIKVAPDRMVAHLNLADSYWAQAHQQRKADRILLDLSKEHYKKYHDLMRKDGKSKRIPKRVQQRME